MQGSSFIKSSNFSVFELQFEFKLRYYHYVLFSIKVKFVFEA